MRLVVDYYSNRRVGTIDDYPPIKPGNIVQLRWKLWHRKYRVMVGDSGRLIQGIYVSSWRGDVSQAATPDYVLGADRR